MDGFLAQIDAKQLGRWQAFAELEPFGFDWQRQLGGVLAATVATFSPRSKKTDWAVADFFRRPAERFEQAARVAVSPAKPQSLKDRIKAAFSAFPQSKGNPT